MTILHKFIEINDFNLRIWVAFKYPRLSNSTRHGIYNFTEVFSYFIAGEDTPQLYMACGRGPRSSIRVLRHGLEVSEMAVSELPGNPNAVWTVKRRIDGS